MKTLAAWVVFGTACLSTAFAQERAAVGAAETQMTWSALAAKVDGANAKVDALSSKLDQVSYCGALGQFYAPNATGADKKTGCLAAGSFKVTGVTTSINGANGYAPNTDLKAKSDLFVSASSYGGGGESCPVGGTVNGVSVANDYAIRYASSVSFMVPKGATWRVVAQGGNCSGRQVNVSVVPLN